MKKLVILPGDGIGPEVVGACEAILDFFLNEGLELEVAHGLVGKASLDEYGDALTESVFALVKSADAILLGSVGGPEYEHLPPDKRPETSLLRLRSELGLYANLRPSQWRRSRPSRDRRSS